MANFTRTFQHCFAFLFPAILITACLVCYDAMGYNLLSFDVLLVLFSRHSGKCNVSLLKVPHRATTRLIRRALGPKHVPSAKSDISSPYYTFAL